MNKTASMAVIQLKKHFPTKCQCFGGKIHWRNIFLLSTVNIALAVKNIQKHFYIPRH